MPIAAVNPESLRWVMGPSFSGHFGKPPAIPTLGPAVVPGADAPARLDVQVEITGVDEDNGKVGISIPPYELAKYNRLVQVRAYLVPLKDSPPADAPGFFASSYQYAEGDVGQIQVGVKANLNLPDVPEDDYVGQLVLGFES